MKTAPSTLPAEDLQNLLIFSRYKNENRKPIATRNPDVDDDAPARRVDYNPLWPVAGRGYC